MLRLLGVVRKKIKRLEEFKMKLFNTYGIKSKNIFYFYIMSIFGGMLFFLPIFALYIEESLFTLTNVALIISIESIAIVLFEYPTGAIADLLGRKKSIIISGFVILLSFVFLAIGNIMIMFVLYAIINAFGRSMFSGADSALIYDTLKQEGKEKYFKKIIGTKYALWPIGASIGAVVGGYLASISLSLPVIMSLIPMSIATFLSFQLVEPKYEKETHKNVFKHMFKSLGVIIKNSQVLIILFSALILIGIGDSLHYLKPIFFQFYEIPIIYFGYIFAIGFTLSSFGHYFSHEVSEKLGDKKTIIMGGFGYSLFYLFATFVFPLIAIILLLIKQFFYGIGRPATEHLLHLETDSSTRATVISGYNLMRGLGVAIFVPLIGFSSDIYNINIGFRIGALIMLIIPVLFLFLRAKKQ